MKLKVTQETGGRKGKQVTVIRGLTHNPQVIEKLAKSIKSQLELEELLKEKLLKSREITFQSTTNFNKGRLHHCLTN